MNMVSDQKIRVLVTICTRGRPVLLQSCLDSVCAQAPSALAAMEILVVENNDQLTCTDLVARQSARTEIPIHLTLEPELGIPFARNCCGIWAAAHGYDWALYIDDDEVARPDWFRIMVEATTIYAAEVFYGRVISIYPPGTPDWMITSEVDKRERGAQLKKAEGHNTMVRTSVFGSAGMGLSFDGSMRFTGGSDTDFFTRVHQAGGRIIWIGDAVVEELMPESRMTTRWQLNRAFRVAINISVLHEKQSGRLAAFLRSALKGVGRMLDGLLRLPLSGLSLVMPKLGKQLGFKAAKQIASGLGSFAYMFGVRPQPYRKVDGG